MNDSEFVKRVKIASEVYKKENLIDPDEHQLMDDFVEWLYKQYGIEFNNGQS